MRKFQFQADKFYHIYNRGTEKRDIFLDKYDYIRFIRSMREFNSVEPVESLYIQDVRKHKECEKGIKNPLRVYDTLRPLVEFVSYCLIPNHFHFLLRQSREGGISEFMRRLSIGYTNYFNQKYNRSGVLFQGKFKAIEVNSYSHFLKLAIYVNCNYEVYKISKAEDCPWSSYLDYIGKRNGTLCNKSIILNDFESSSDFKYFCEENLSDILENKEVGKLSLEEQ